MSSDEFEVLLFETPEKWRDWLTHNHHSQDGVWVRFAKKNSNIISINYDQALDEALCFGWIDSQVKSVDEMSYRQKFTPRRTKSMWSKRNTEHVARLIEMGKMAPAGLEQVELAKADGRWQQAYDSPSQAQIPDDFLAALANNKEAAVFFGSLNKTNIYAIAWRIQTAKTAATRTKRIEAIISMLSKGQPLH